MNDYSNAANVFKAFDDEKRLKILEMLRLSEKCACVILEDLQIGQSTLSHHMKILCESGIVDSRREGKWTYYCISKEGSKKAVELIKAITAIE